MSVRCAWLLSFAVTLTGCRKAPVPNEGPARGEGQGHEADGGALSADAAAPESRWFCAARAGEAFALPREAELGTLDYGAEDDAAPLLAYIAPTDGARHHATLQLKPASAPRVGPTAAGDVPPWTPIVGAAGEGSARIVAGAMARWVLELGGRDVVEAPLALGDELAIDALATGEAKAVVAVSSAEGVDVRAVEGSRVVRAFRVDGGESPALLRGEGGAVAVAVRVETPAEAAKPVRDVPTASLEGAGQDRSTATLVVVDGNGTRLASLALGAAEELVAVTPSRRSLVLGARRVLEGQAVVDLARVGADGRRTRIGEFPRRRGSRLVPIEDGRDGRIDAVLEVSSDGVAALGVRAGSLGLPDVDAVLAARTHGDELDLVGVRDVATAPQVVRVTCRWEVR